MFKKPKQVLVVDIIEKQLSNDATGRTKNIKPLRPNELSEWELRVEECRVFYDVNVKSKIVMVKAIGWKEHNKLFVRWKEF